MIVTIPTSTCVITLVASSSRKQGPNSARSRPRRPSPPRNEEDVRHRCESTRGSPRVTGIRDPCRPRARKRDAHEAHRRRDGRAHVECTQSSVKSSPRGRTRGETGFERETRGDRTSVRVDERERERKGVRAKTRARARWTYFRVTSSLFLTRTRRRTVASVRRRVLGDRAATRQ